MLEGEDFSLFDDKQTEVLDTKDKSEDTAEDTAEDTDTSTDTSVSEDTKSDDEGTDDDTSSDASDGEGSSETDNSTDETNTEETDEVEAEPETDTSSDKSEEPEEKFATKEDVRSALAEQERQREAQSSSRRTLRNELRSELFPDGVDIDLQIKDCDNGLITGPSQIAGKLINPSTQELFTYEEARDYWDGAQKQIDKKVEEREQLIDSYAENNQSFYEGSQVVEQKYGAFLKANPKIAKQLLDNYLAGAKITKTGYITEMPINVVSYYESVMSPMNSVASQMELQRQGEETKKAVADAKAGQADRADLPVNSTTAPKAKKDDLTGAFDRYFEGK